MSKTKIEWTDEVWNPVTGCTKVSQGCKNCYAERIWPRLAGNEKSVAFGRPFSDVQCHHERLEQPSKWGKSRMVFVNSMSDLFHEDVPFKFILHVFFYMACCQRHTFQVLTKRPERMLEWFRWFAAEKPGFDPSDPYPNVWLGVSIEDQQTADARIPLLLQTPAAVRFVSVEPMLGPVDLRYSAFNGADSLQSLEGLDWVICGGESGPKARPMHPDWARSLRGQCAAADVPFFFKQWGEWAPPEDIDATGLAHNGYYEDCREDGGVPQHEWQGITTPCLRPISYRVGKKVAGCLLDGIEHKGMPARYMQTAK